MSSSQDSLGSNYTIQDKNGIRKVKDCKEYPITEEEYRKDNPEHKDVGCTECSFVVDKKTLLLYGGVPKALKENAGRRLVNCGKFTMPGWVGHSNFYIFKCPFCKHVAIDYPHGYRRGCIYVRCDECRYEIILHPRKYLDIYERDNIHIPRCSSWTERIKAMVFLGRNKDETLPRLKP